jgi:hypothetical protein
LFDAQSFFPADREATLKWNHAHQIDDVTVITGRKILQFFFSKSYCASSARRGAPTEIITQHIRQTKSVDRRAGEWLPGLPLALDRDSSPYCRKFLARMRAAVFAIQPGSRTNV